MYDKEDNLFKIQHVHNYHIVIIEKQSRTEQEYSRQEQVTKLPDVTAEWPDEPKTPSKAVSFRSYCHNKRGHKYTCWHFYNKQTWYGQVVDICTIFPSVPSIL